MEKGGNLLSGSAIPEQTCASVCTLLIPEDTRRRRRQEAFGGRGFSCGGEDRGCLQRVWRWHPSWLQVSA